MKFKTRVATVATAGLLALGGAALAAPAAMADVATPAVLANPTVSGCTLASNLQFLCKPSTPTQSTHSETPPSTKQWVFCGLGVALDPLLGSAQCLIDFAWHD